MTNAAKQRVAKPEWRPTHPQDVNAPNVVADRTTEEWHSTIPLSGHLRVQSTFKKEVTEIRYECCISDVYSLAV